jgi:Domain of unknown function (DUF6647)
MLLSVRIVGALPIAISLSTCAALLAPAPVRAEPPERVVAITAEPHHEVRFDNGGMRLVEVVFLKGNASLFHTHLLRRFRRFLQHGRVGLPDTRRGGTGVEGIERVTPSEHAEISLQVLLEKVCAWLVTGFDLPAATKLPTVMIVPPVRMAALRYHGLAPISSDASDFIALYDGRGRTIYLPEGWRGATAAEVSILVHEMVHYLQDMAGQRFECVEQEERLAYAAQDRWLVLAGSSLERAFGVDAFTVLARSTCVH